MKTSKPFSFVLWANSGELPLYIHEVLGAMPDWGWMHWIHHKPEKEPPSLLKRVKREKPKHHYHCLLSWRKPLDFSASLEPIVRAWATSHPEWGECPITWDRTHEGKCLNVSAWLAYVIHHPAYMAYCERKRDKPETHKRCYKWDDIQSTDDLLLERQLHNAVAYIDQCITSEDRVNCAKSLAVESPSLRQALLNCETYNQMQIVRAVYCSE